MEKWPYELGQWLISLERPFAFLLALPFLVALAGLISYSLRTRGRLTPKR
jgi:hypothetical protein